MHIIQKVFKNKSSHTLPVAYVFLSSKTQISTNNGRFKFPGTHPLVGTTHHNPNFKNNFKTTPKPPLKKILVTPAISGTYTYISIER